MARVSAAQRNRLLARGWRRLLPLVASDFRTWYVVIWNQPHDDDPQDARSGHALLAYARVLLDRTRIEPADRGRFSDSDRNVCHASSGPLLRFPLLHQRSRWQPHDVYQPHLDLGASGGLHPYPSGLWRVLGSRRDL